MAGLANLISIDKTAMVVPLLQEPDERYWRLLIAR